MKVGFLLSPAAIVSGASSGVRQQALIWRDGLMSLGVEVVLLDTWQDYRWGGFDVVHVFQSGDWLRSVIPSLRKKVKRLVFSPIIDTTQPAWAYRIAASLKVPLLRLQTENAIAAEAASLCDLVLARSTHEQEIVVTGLKVRPDRVQIRPIGFIPRESMVTAPLEREPVCLHVSSYSQPRKNGLKLIAACKQADVPLWLVGNPGTGDDKRRIEEAIGDDPRIKTFGFLNTPELGALFARAKVFALPSVNEGVGLSALEAASAGCEVVITQRGGPKDYFSNLAHYVEPSSVDSIASGIKEALSSASQPALKQHVDSSYLSVPAARGLLEAYQGLVA